ncbi:MAG: RHS repeat-associated core domain-containing protein [Terracidiphilus sp.]|nr:RHS repeat-associated core domain-containing protein [Terracidiphilus sp.]
MDESSRRVDYILSYDDKNLLKEKDYSDGTSYSYNYDGHRNLLSIASSSGTTSFSYNNADQLTGVTYPNGRWVKYFYDNAGRRNSMSDQSGYAVNYSYDSAGRLSTVTAGTGSLLASYTYDEAGRLSRKTLGNGAFSTYEYDAAGNLVHLINYQGGSAVNSRFDYGYDAAGRRISMGTLSGMWQYGYDANGQLTSVTLPTGSTITYTYDAAGNRTQVTSGTGTVNYTVNSLNQYTAAGPATFGYDADGNMTAKFDNGAWSYDYNVENRLVSVTGPSDSWRYEYDALGNRTAVVKNGVRAEYLVDPTGMGNVIAQYDGSGSAQNHFAYGRDLTSIIPAVGNAGFYQFDASGSTATVTGQGGSLLNAYTYLPFGEVLKSNETIVNPFTFVGEYGVMGETNSMYYMRARYYDSGRGRFLSQDPLKLESDINSYRYSSDNPNSLIDPLGLKTIQIGGTVSVSGGATGSYFTGYVCDDHGNWGRFDTFGGGGSLTDTKFGWFAGIQAAISKADTIFDLQGWSSETDVSFGNWTGSFSPDGGSVGFGAGAGGGGSRVGTYTRIDALPSKDNPCNPPKPPSGCVPMRSIGMMCSSPGNPTPDPGHRETTPTPHSGDPNGKMTVGFGDQGYIPPTATITYTIFFENMPTATAAAQQVVVTDPLDSNLDWSTVQLTQIGFNNVTLSIPAGMQSYSTQTSVSTDPNPVQVTAALNPSSGALTWTMQSINPTTGGVPSDPLAGFLPPNDASHRGDGFVTFTVKPRSGLVNGTAIHNEASIVFDANSGISTNTVTNTIDSVYPTSSVNALPATSASASFTVSWSGTDPAGAGIATYDIYVSTDSGPYTTWLAATTSVSGTFSGAVGHSYSFYSMATDNVGHRQQTPGPAQTTSTGGGTSITYTVTPSAGTGGSLSPSTPQTVSGNATTSFTVTASSGYQIASVTGCGGVLSGTTYTTGPITANCTVTASFSLVTGSAPVLSITKTHAGNFTQGQNGATYTVTVSNNVSAGPTSGSVTVTETIPTGLTLDSLSGIRWTCASNTCTRTDVLNAGSSYEPITVKVNVASNAGAAVTNQIAVSGGGSTPATASDPTTITTTTTGLPGAPALISPTNVSSGVSTAPRLTWSAATGATSYDVYLGLVPAQPSLVTNTTATTYTPSTALNQGAAYFWKIVAKNSAGSTSSDTWVFTTQTQSAPPPPPPPLACVTSLTPSTLTVPGVGGTATFSVQTSSSCSWNIAGLPSWITVPGGTGGNGSLTLTLSVAPNAGSARSAVLNVDVMQLTVNQAAPCACTISSAGQSIPVSGGSGTISVSAAADCVWAMSAPPAWVTFTGATSGTGNGGVTFQVSANPGAHRSATVTAGGASFEFDQLGATSTPAGALAHFAAGAGWDTTFTLVNTGYGVADAQLLFYDSNGNRITTSAQSSSSRTKSPAVHPSASGSTSPSGTQVAANGVLQVSAPVVPGNGNVSTTGWAQLMTDGSVQGYGTFRLDATSQEAVVPPETRNAASYYLPFDNTAGYFYGVALANTSDMQQGVHVIIRDAASGDVIGQDTIPLDGQAQTSFLLTDRYPALINVRGTIEFRPLYTGQISVLGLRFNPNHAFTSVPVLVASAAAGSTQLAAAGSMPQFAAGGGWRTVYTLANTGTTTAEAKLSFFDDNGKPVALPLLLPQSTSNKTQTSSTFDQMLAAGTMLTIETASTASTSQTGWAQLQTNGSVSGFAVFQYQPVSGGQQEAVVPVQTGAATSYMLPFSNTNGYTDGIALANTSSVAATVGLTLRDATTGNVITTGSVALPAQGHTSFMLPSQFPAAAGASGTLEVRGPSSGVISVLGLHVNASNAFTSTPALVKQ